MTFPLSRLMSTATASYGVYALVDPSHLGKFLDPKNAASYDTLAQTYGARDLILSAVALKGRSEKTVTAAMVMRILSDLSDAAILSAQGTQRGDAAEAARGDRRLGEPQRARPRDRPSPGQEELVGLVASHSRTEGPCSSSVGGA